MDGDQVRLTRDDTLRAANKGEGRSGWFSTDHQAAASSPLQMEQDGARGSGDIGLPVNTILRSSEQGNSGTEVERHR